MKLTSIFKSMAAIAFAAAAVVSCKTDKIETPDTLSVEPKETINFLATDNQSVDLKVTTNAESWDFSAPEWVKAEKKGDILSVNAEDNTGDERLGRITITAGAAEPVKINVVQAAAGSVEPGPGDGVSVKFNQVTEDKFVYIKSETTATVKVNISIEEAVDYDIVATVEFDEKYLDEYNLVNGSDCKLFPKDKATFSAELKIEKGKTVSSDLEVSLDASEIDFGSGYLVPLRAKAGEESGAVIARENSRVNYIVMRQNPRTIKNVLYFEVNDTNPLNALEYNLADGTPFFDAVILFAANINYDSINDKVYLHNNPNVQALLDETDVYIQPLREKGIKVYLGLLGNHDAAGLCQLSDWGCYEWAKEVAKAVRDYKLDGVNLDDEYSGAPISNPWFTNRSGKAGSQLMLELKLAMQKECYWPTEVSYFDWGSLYTASACKAWVDGVDQPGNPASGQEYTPGQFVDFHVANYGGSSSSYADVGLDKCSGASLQCNYGASMSESQARSIKENGYGWCMWFAFDPSGTGSISSNLSRSWDAMTNAAKGFYDQELQRPTGVYHKVREGVYDPERHPLNF